MTTAEAQAILHLCPPGDDADAGVPGLAEARNLAATDATLAAWWEQEKFFDEQFHRKLSSLTPPAELSATILRGGATIFFARRLIAESAGETPDEPPEQAGDPAATIADPTAFTTADGAKPSKPAPSQTMWFLRFVIFSAGIIFVLLLILLLVAFYLNQ